MATVIAEDTFDDLLHETLQLLIDKGVPIAPTKGPAVEETAVLLQLRDPRSRLSRGALRSTIVSCIGELCWYLGGSDEETDIAYYVPRYSDYAVGGHLLGAYGPRLFSREGVGQVNRIIGLLRRKPQTRQAVIQLFDQRDLVDELLDLPCTCTLQFLLRENKLQLVVTMRSNDAFRGLTHDLFAFTMIQELVANSLEVGLGTYSHFVGSLHLYEADRERAEEYLADGWYTSATASMPPIPAGEPWSRVADLLRIERSIRESAPDDLDLSQFSDDYWGDLARVLAAHRLKNDRADALSDLSTSLTNPYFSIYITDRAFGGR